MDRALDRVGLDREAASRPLRKYSRGMLQRIGLAQALLGAPRYVFLDEPASGVDPAGVILFRQIIAELKHHGVTVIMNSHQLEQVERVCDRVAFVSRGRVEAIETLQASASLERRLRVRWTGDAVLDAAHIGALAAEAGATVIHTAPHEARFVVADDAGAARLIATLVRGGLAVAEATPEEGRLERLFLETPAARAG